jgi:hypothetical protein
MKPKFSFTAPMLSVVIETMMIRAQGNRKFITRLYANSGYLARRGITESHMCGLAWLRPANRARQLTDKAKMLIVTIAMPDSHHASSIGSSPR